jgi:hypothetical protein
MNENPRHQQEYFREEVGYIKVISRLYQGYIKARLKITFCFVHEIPVGFYEIPVGFYEIPVDFYVE